LSRFCVRRLSFSASNVFKSKDSSSCDFDKGIQFLVGNVMAAMVLAGDWRGNERRGHALRIAISAIIWDYARLPHLPTFTDQEVPPVYRAARADGYAIARVVMNQDEPIAERVVKGREPPPEQIKEEFMSGPALTDNRKDKAND